MNKRERYNHIRFTDWSGETPQSSDARTPVTIVSGFLGSGKTTFVNRLIAQKGYEKCAIIMNDFGQVNLDAHFLRQQREELKKDQEDETQSIHELSGGCLCCNLKSQLHDALLRLHLDSHVQEILIETTGLANPLALLQDLFTRNRAGIRPLDFLHLKHLYTLVDVSSTGLLGEAKSPTQEKPRRAHLLFSDTRKPIEELQHQQIEAADIILINKTDLVGNERTDALMRSLKELNPGASLLPTTHGKLPSTASLPAENYGERLKTRGPKRFFSPLPEHFKPTVKTHPPTTDANQNHPSEIGVCVFESRQPIDAYAFLKYIREGIPGLLRAKGIYWTIQQPNQMGELSVAGKIVRADYRGSWWQSRLEAGEVDFEALPDFIKEQWHPENGDKRQQLLFIGIELNCQSIQDKLTSLLKLTSSS